MLRRLRIAVSVFFALVAVALCVLWVRSYWHVDNVIGPATGTFRPGVASANGWLTVRYGNGSLGPQSFPKWTIQSKSAEAMEKVYKQMEQSIKGTTATFSRPSHKFGWKDNWGFQFHYWLPILITGSLAAALGWSPQWRFGLRTMLIVVTLVAVVLGLAIWAMR